MLCGWKSNLFKAKIFRNNGLGQDMVPGTDRGLHSEMGVSAIWIAAFKMVS